MRTLHVCALLLTLLALPSPAPAEPIKLHPDNPHYFLFEGRPTILLTSAEHYGAVLNLDFDYVKYLDALKKRGFNYTKIFSGAYREIPNSFGIERNDLAPARGRYACPWARSDQDGYALGGKKFDLEKWDEAYFKRLKDFVEQAGRRGIVVELSLFCPFYEQKKGDVDALWKASPMHAANNVNGIGTCLREKAYTLENGKLIAVQEAMTRKIVQELSGFDNIFYEISNEPYFGGVTEQWQGHIAHVIEQAEASGSRRHLIAQNIANHSKKIEKPNPRVSVFNFHYAAPQAVAENLGLERVIGDDETGFKGSAAEPYRVEGWRFLMAGGGLYNNLDYGYTVKSPEGLDQANKAPGSTTTEIRDQLEILRTFFEGLDFIHMKPVTEAERIKAPDKVTVGALAQDQKLIAAYFARETDKAGKPITPESVSTEEKASPGKAATGGEASLELGGGKWKAEWISPLTGKTVKQETFTHTGGRRELKMPPFARDIALKLKRVQTLSHN